MKRISRDLASNASRQEPSEIFCPPIHTWILDERTASKITAVTTIIICPVAILLNILVIMIVKKRRDLKNNKSNILLASLAVADVLIGAVSMPLTFTLDVLVLVKFLNASTFCSIAFVNDTVLYIGSCSAVYHLTVIAWERCVAINKWMDYKVIVTRNRVKKYARIAWILAVLSPIPPSTMKIAGVQYKYLLVVDIICVVPGAVCILLIGYFYIRVYFGVRRQELDKIREVLSLIKAKIATKVAKRTAVLTAVVLISFVPSLVFLFFGELLPSLRRSLFFRWSMMLAQLNSLFDPVLYCYRDCRFRKAMLEMLRMKKPAPRAQRRQSISAQSLEDAPEIQRLPRSRTCVSLIHLRDTAHLSSATEDVTRGRRMSAPPRHATHTVIQVDVHQPKINTSEPRIQIESGMTRQGDQSHDGEDTSDQPEASKPLKSPQPQGGSSLHPSGLQPTQGPSKEYVRETTRSKSLNEKELAGVIYRQQRCQQEVMRRPKTSLPTSAMRTLTMPGVELTRLTSKL